MQNFKHASPRMSSQTRQYTGPVCDVIGMLRYWHALGNISSRLCVYPANCFNVDIYQTLNQHLINASCLQGKRCLLLMTTTCKYHLQFKSSRIHGIASPQLVIGGILHCQNKGGVSVIIYCAQLILLTESNSGKWHDNTNPSYYSMPNEPCSFTRQRG